ncbi:MAG: hypothetical protein [Podoviridae sp. ctLUJ1]|nr:MAG: hypothetical protein [Podoviridae sp. ctLUJ1]
MSSISRVWNAACNSVVRVFSTIDKTLASVENVATIGEKFTKGMVDEQDLLIKKRLEDLTKKVDKKYEQEKSTWNI